MTARAEEERRKRTEGQILKTKDADNDGSDSDVHGGKATAQVVPVVMKSKKIPPKPPQRRSSTVSAAGPTATETGPNESGDGSTLESKRSLFPL